MATINSSLMASSSALERATKTLDGRVVRAFDGLVGAMDTAAEKLRTAHRTRALVVWRGGGR